MRTAKTIWAIFTALALIGAAAQAAPPQNGNPPPAAAPQTTPAPSTTETIILIRHGEKTPSELGQLNAQGLNRSLSLPDVLIGKFGKPDYIFAPNPSDKIGAGHDLSYAYIRPLATIEPTAIRLGMPVNTQIGFRDIKDLQDELTQPKYAGAVVFIAWEHGMEDEFAKNVMAACGKDASVVPDWAGDDYDSIFVLRLVHTGATTAATFTLDHEGLNGKLSSKWPVAAGP